MYSMNITMHNVDNVKTENKEVNRINDNNELVKYTTTRVDFFDKENELIFFVTTFSESEIIKDLK